MSRLVAPLRTLVGTTVSSLGLIERVVAGELSTVVDSLVGHTTVLPFGAPYTRFNGRLGPERAVCAGSWAKKRIQAVQRAADVTANDVITAIVAGVMRHWLRDRGELPKQSLVAVCPITVRDRERDPSSDQHGNMFGLWLCPLGTNVDDPVARLDADPPVDVGGKTLGGQNADRRASLLTSAGSIAATIVSPVLPFTRKIRTGFNMPIPHVPGPQAEIYWNGAHIEEMYPVSTVDDGLALNVTMCSYSDRVGFGYAQAARAISAP